MMGNIQRMRKIDNAQLSTLFSLSWKEQYMKQKSKNKQNKTNNKIVHYIAEQYKKK
jgi:hypothetical protein